MISRYITWFKAKMSTFCPQNVFMSFVWIAEKAAIISLHSINWLVFITETEYAHCAVRTRYLNVIQVDLHLKNDRVMAKAVGRRPITAKARVRPPISPCVIWGGKVALGEVFLSVGILRFPPVNMTSSTLHTILIDLLTIRTPCDSSTSQHSSGKLRSLDTYTFFFLCL